MSRQSVPVKRQWFINSHTDDIATYYTIQGDLGAGAYGQVVKGVHKTTGVIRAIKQVQKPKVKDYLSFKTELELLSRLDHPNIVRVIETFETNLKCYLVLELCEGGELFDYIVNQHHLTEAEAARLMKQLFSAVNFMHSNGVCHRDLKPENCLLMSRQAGSDVKIIDFGLAQELEADEVMHGLEGTPYYLAPEILEGSYDNQVDCWSLGVILYIMLSGTPPFNGRTTEEILHKVKTGYVNFKPAAFKLASQPAKDLISQLLRKDPSLRLTAAQACAHPWIQGTSPYPSRPLGDDVLTGIRSFIQANVMKKMALFYIATHINEQDVPELRTQFQQMDANCDGTLNKEEMGRALAQMGKRLDDAQLNVLFSVIDTNQNGRIEYTEFIAACIQTRHYVNSGVLLAAFRYFDTDNSGKISAEELKEAVSSHEALLQLSQQQVETILREADLDHDGTINYQEFLNLMARRVS